MTDQAEQLYQRMLVLRCQAGDEAAFAELVERWSPRLRYYLRKMLGDAHTAEDLLQEMWLDVWRGLPRLLDSAALAAWLYRIARDRTFRLLRKQRPAAQPLIETDLPDNGTGDEEFRAEDAAVLSRSLTLALARLGLTEKEEE